MSHHLLAEIVLIVVFAAVIAYLSHRLKQLPIVGFLIAGVLIGPHALGLVKDLELIDAVAEIGVILLLFTLGIEFSLDRLNRLRRLIVVGGGIQVVTTIAIAAGLLLLFGIEWRAAVFTGALVALSSTAIVLKVIASSGEQSTERGQASIGILIFQDLAVILLVLLIPVLGGGSDSPVEIATAVGTAVALIVVVIAVARKLLPPLLERIAETCSPEIFILSIIGICLGITWLTSLTGVSLSLGAFIAGIVVSESRFSHHALSEILPLQILFSAAFFVSVGMLLDLSVAAERPLVVLGLVFAVLVVKLITTSLGGLALGLPRHVTIPAALLLAQVGEFSFVLERAGRAYGLSPGGLGETGTQYFITSTVILMILTPFLARLGRRFSTPRSVTPQPHPVRAEPIPEEQEEGHVIIAGYGNAARYLGRVLRDTGVPFVVVTLSPEGMSEVAGEKSRVIGGDYARRAILEEAGILKAKLLVIPDDQLERAHQVTAIARNLNPSLRIIVRTRHVEEVEDLQEAGADQVVPEELEAAVELFGRVLTEYEISREAAERYKDRVRVNHYERVVSGDDERIVVCEELDSSCLERRRVTLGQGAPVLGNGIDFFREPLSVSSIRRDGRELSVTNEIVLTEGDEVTLEGPAEAFLSIFDQLRPAEQKESLIELSEKQRASSACTHTPRARRFVPPPLECRPCVEAGDSWVHLRICMICGQVGCCDSSPNRHASAHASAERHPLIRSLEPGETWVWCFEDEAYLD